RQDLGVGAGPASGNAFASGVAVDAGPGDEPAHRATRLRCARTPGVYRAPIQARRVCGEPNCQRGSGDCGETLTTGNTRLALLRRGQSTADQNFTGTFIQVARQDSYRWIGS